MVYELINHEIAIRRGITKTLTQYKQAVVYDKKLYETDGLKLHFLFCLVCISYS